MKPECLQERDTSDRKDGTSHQALGRHQGVPTHTKEWMRSVATHRMAPRARLAGTPGHAGETRERSSMLSSVRPRRWRYSVEQETASEEKG